jgi:hypothetical protein
METLAVIGVISGLGFYFSNKTENIRKVDIDDEIHDEIPEIEKPVSSNIYNSNMVESANDTVLRMSLQNYKDSQEPSITGILPPIYNSYSVVGNVFVGDAKAVKQIAAITSINRQADINTGKQPDLPDRPMFQPILNMGDPTVSQFSNYGQNVENNKFKSLLTGKDIEKEHNNMIPFFGSNVRQNVEEFTNESKLDNYTGNTSTFIHKKEPLQRFEQYTQDIYGTPLFSDNVDLTRFSTNTSRFKQGEKPFYAEKIAAPISFTEENPVTKASLMYKTVDELRAANKPQISYEAKINHGKSTFNARGQQGKVAKNRVDTSFEHGEKRLFRGPGQVVGKKLNENYAQLQQTSRQDQNLEYYGTAVNTELGTQQRISQYDNSSDFASLLQSSKRNQLDSGGVRNANSLNSPYTHDYGKSSMNPPTLERESTSQFHTININQSAKGSVLAKQDHAKNTLKETLVGLSDTKRNIKSNVNVDSNTGLTSHLPKTTHKETALYEHKGQANKKDGMGYVVTNYDAKTTNKETTHTDYSGHASGSNKNSTVYSTYDDPIKMRNGIHVKDYMGPSITSVGDAENRDKYYNAEISIFKENALLGERPSGSNSALGKNASDHTFVGEIKSNDNLLLKERYNVRAENINNICNNIPTTNILGSFTKQGFEENEIFSTDKNNRNNRFNADLINEQLSNNPFYNLKR